MNFGDRPEVDDIPWFILENERILRDEVKARLLAPSPPSEEVLDMLVYVTVGFTHWSYEQVAEALTPELVERLLGKEWLTL